MTFSSEFSKRVLQTTPLQSQALETVEGYFEFASAGGEDVGPGRLLADIVIGSYKCARKTHSGRAVTEHH